MRGIAPIAGRIGRALAELVPVCPQDKGIDRMAVTGKDNQADGDTSL